MTKDEKLKAVLKWLEEERGWNLFNALTKQGEKLVSDTMDAVRHVENFELFEEKLEAVPYQKKLIWFCLQFLKWIVFMVGVVTILDKWL